MRAAPTVYSEPVTITRSASPASLGRAARPARPPRRPGSASTVDAAGGDQLGQLGRRHRPGRRRRASRPPGRRAGRRTRRASRPGPGPPACRSPSGGSRSRRTRRRASRPRPPAPSGLWAPSRTSSGARCTTSNRPGSRSAAERLGHHVGVQRPAEERLDRRHRQRGVVGLVGAVDRQEHSSCTAVRRAQVDDVAAERQPVGHDPEVGRRAPTARPGPRPRSTVAASGSGSPSTRWLPGFTIPAFSSAIAAPPVAHARRCGRGRCWSPPPPGRRRRWWRRTARAGRPRPPPRRPPPG